MIALAVRYFKRRQWILSLLADIGIIWSAYLFYSTNGYYNAFFSAKTIFILLCVAVCYTIGSVFNLIQNRKNADYQSTGYIFWKTILDAFQFIASKDHQKPYAFFSNNHEKTVFLFTLVKVFFIPLMLQFAINNYNDFSIEITRVQSYAYNNSWMQTLNNVVYPLAITCFFLVDTLLYTFGYLIESSFLKNRIRSVEGTWLGWMAALICYPPLNEVFSKLAPQQSFTYAYFGSTEFTFAARFVMMFLVFIYAFASVSLGAKCSNLTNRGIVTKGAYSIVRHPAYISKVLFWWITIIPVMKPYPFVTVAMLAGTGIYFLRAATEERHLASDGDYLRYCSIVRYRFIPFIY